jgi:acyl-CoA oxidase
LKNSIFPDLFQTRQLIVNFALLTAMPDFSDNLKPAPPDGPTILANERSGSNLNVDELAHELLSRDDFLQRQERIVKILESVPVFSKKRQSNLSRPERYHLGLARAKTLRRLLVKHGWTHEDYKMAEYLVDEMSPYHLTMTMFVTSVREQGDEAQRAYWLPKIENFDIIGCYAQTEMGHGSNVRGLELQAKWDPQQKSFILHSPYLTASKWWNGALGRTANHAIVAAQLLLPKNNKPGGEYVSYGVHQFMVQIRDMKTHKPLDGIVVGDIGPKYGYQSMDNGYMLFNNFKVPHNALLSRYSKVDPNTGEYSQPSNPAVVYGSLTFVRAQIIMHSRLILARAVTVATRYTSIRRQFRDRDAKDQTGLEMAVLDYPTVQIRILPLLATTFALHYTGEAMFNLYYRTRSNIEKGDFSALAELHSTSSGLKSLCTTLAADGIETCRRAMGGHGFHGSSGLVSLNADYLSKPTVEGDNWMITQQTASYLIKKMSAAAKAPSAPATDSLDKLYKTYLSQSQSTWDKSQPNTLASDDHILLAFQTRAAALAHKAYTAREVEHRGWNTLLPQLHALSHAQSHSLLVTYFHAAITSPSDSLSPTSVAVLKSLYRLFALFTISQNSYSFLRSANIAPAALDSLEDRIVALMAEIRPHAVKLVDAWSIPEYLLDSALGRKDGDVYGAMWRMVHKENGIMNKVTFNPDWRSEEIVKGSGEGVERILAKL